LQVRRDRKRKTKTIRAIPCEVYTRVVCYYRPVSNFNPGKQEEFRDRKYINLPPFLKN